MTEISIIIVSWNAKEYLRECLNSIHKTCRELSVEVIVVDNASGDGSASMVAAEFPGVRLVCARENLGFARANNLGMKQAAGDYYALLNSDVVVHPRCLQILSSFLESHPNVGLLGPAIVGKDETLQPTCRRLPTVWNTVCRTLALDRIWGWWPWFSEREGREVNREQPREVEVVSGCFWLVRRKAVAEVGGLDERFFFYAEDVDWCKRFWESGWKVMYVPDAVATHFGGGSSNNAPFLYSIELLRAGLSYWEKHYGRLGQIFFYSMVVVHHASRLFLRGLNQLASKRATAENFSKFRRSFFCLRWLLTGKGA